VMFLSSVLNDLAYQAMTLSNRFKNQFRIPQSLSRINRNEAK
jgi:hypothetical protein